MSTNARVASWRSSKLKMYLTLTDFCEDCKIKYTFVVTREKVDSRMVAPGCVSSRCLLCPSFRCERAFRRKAASHGAMHLSEEQTDLVALLNFLSKISSQDLLAPWAAHAKYAREGCRCVYPRQSLTIWRFLRRQAPARSPTPPLDSVYLLSCARFCMKLKSKAPHYTRSDGLIVDT